MRPIIPELLSPAGSLEKLKTAVRFGADAVYCGGQSFNLRSAAENFTDEELKEGIQFAHDHGSQCFLVLNNFFFDKDLAPLKEFVSSLVSLKVDALIVSDLGAIECLKSFGIPIHLSTQANCLNRYAAKTWKDMGVKRIIAGREISLREAQALKEASGLEVELFIHGSMCMAYSGHCVISNYTSGRDSNRGGCAHSCRHEYQLDFSQGPTLTGQTFMSSKDLAGLQLLPQYCAAGIDSIKIEGRMKGHNYVGTVTKVYRQALDVLASGQSWSAQQIEGWENDLKKVAHRGYTEASLVEPAGADSIFDGRNHLEYVDQEVVGVLVDSGAQFNILQVRHPFLLDDQLEFVPPRGDSQSFRLSEWKNPFGEKIEKLRPGTLIRIPSFGDQDQGALVRKEVHS